MRDSLANSSSCYASESRCSCKLLVVYIYYFILKYLLKIGPHDREGVQLVNKPKTSLSWGRHRRIAQINKMNLYLAQSLNINDNSFLSENMLTNSPPSSL